MNILKDVVMESVSKIPDNATEEETINELQFISHVLKGLKDIKEGRTFTTEEILEQVEEWSK